MKNLHEVRETSRRDIWAETLREVTPEGYTRRVYGRFVEAALREPYRPGDPAVFHRLDQTIWRLLSLGLREGEVVVPISPAERRQYDDWLMGRMWLADGATTRWTYRGWPLTVLP